RHGKAGAASWGGSHAAPWSAATRLELAFDAALRLALGDVAALVAPFLAARERELDLCAAVLEVEPRRHERQPALGDLRAELVDLAAVQQQLPVAVRVVRLDRRLLVWRDVEAHEPDLAVARVGIGALQDDVPFA